MNAQRKMTILVLTLLIALPVTAAESKGNFTQIVKKIGSKLAGPLTIVRIAGQSVAGTLTRVRGAGWDPDVDTSLPCIQSSASSSSGPNQDGDIATATAKATTALFPICTYDAQCDLEARRNGEGVAYAVCKKGFVTDFRQGLSGKMLTGLTSLEISFEEISQEEAGPAKYHRRISALPFDSYSNDMPARVARLILDPAGLVAQAPGEIFAEIDVTFIAGNLEIACEGFLPCMDVSDFIVNPSGFTYVGPSNLTVMVPRSVELADEEYVLGGPLISDSGFEPGDLSEWSSASGF